MPRAPVAGREIRRRSRNGCWNCKARKVKCGEEKPRCNHCERLDEECDYKIRLSWGGRPLKSKKLQQQQENANGTDQNGDDTTFIPGAGQFSLTQHFPAPQTFVQTSSTNGTRRPPVPRVGSGKKTSMSNYQTVFAVGEASLPPTPPVQNHVSAPATPPTPKVKTEGSSPPSAAPLSVQIPSPPAQMSDPRTGVHSATTPTNYTWSHPPNSAPPTTATFNRSQINSPSIHHHHHHHNHNGYFQHSYVTQAPYSPTHPSTSPINAYPSPLIKAGSTSPDMQFQPLGSPQQTKQLYHPAPGLTTSPSKRPRTISTSPPHDPPDSPYLRYDDRHLASRLTDHMRFMDTPITSAPMTGMDMQMSHPAVTGIGMGSSVALRRLSVDQLLAEPLQTYSSGVFGGSYPAVADPFQSKVESHTYGPVVDNLGMDDDDDVEEIQRNEMYSNFPNSTRFMVNPGYPSHISIPRPLAPLPQLLLGNPKNLMYFDHYLKHTARLLVIHDCSENPFKHILPQMAVQTDHLMNLLLAYSASHQARLLDSPEPTERISEFIDETVRSLNIALNNPKSATSDASLATAIMLASYQIVTPNPFERDGLTWRLHLNAARKIVLSRGGAQGMHSNDSVSYFLGRWFAYLDLIGRLSGREIDEPISSGKYWTSDNEDEGEEYSVDCFFGFTRRCITILANIGELARQCEVMRRQHYRSHSDMMMSLDDVQQTGMDEEWTPPPDIFNKAWALHAELMDSCEKSRGKCSDHDHLPTQHDGAPSDFDQDELMAANEAFHRAAEIHLYRRVLGYPIENESVQNAVGLIVKAMYKVREAGTAENCLLFPMFTAGCEATNLLHRGYVQDRMMLIEKTGLTQVKNARLLMERVWKEQVPWWEIVNGEFIG